VPGVDGLEVEKGDVHGIREGELPWRDCRRR
jgi:hypothetical protein